MGSLYSTVERDKYVIYYDNDSCHYVEVSQYNTDPKHSVQMDNTNYFSYPNMDESIIAPEKNKRKSRCAGCLYFITKNE